MNTPDGLKIVFTAHTRHGRPGDIKTMSYSVADQLVKRGLAKPYVTPIEKPAPVPAYAFKVTALCPTFNRRKYIPTSIALFLNQTLASSELLILDDSYDSVKDLVPVHPRIRYARVERGSFPDNFFGHDGRMLIGAKRNLACELANGEFIAHWDDDDWQAPGRLADQVAQLEKFNKQVLTYHNILYWNEPGQYACRCFPSAGLRAIHGATLCYRKSWWQEHKFPPIGGGEDTEFGLKAQAQKQLLITDAKELMVVRAHGNNDQSVDERGNTCRTADHMGTPAIPKCSVNLIPKAFFDPLAPVVEIPPSTEDAVIGVIKNYDWPAIRAYAVSLNRSGFKGNKLMFVEDVTQQCRDGLLSNGFSIVDFKTPHDVAVESCRDYLTFGRHRFKPVIDYLRSQPSTRYRNLVWCDVRDLVFQSDPCAWLERNFKGPGIVAAGEGWRIKDEGYNDRWLRRVAPQDYEWMSAYEICCSGTFAGDSTSMLGVFERIYEMTLATRNVVPDNADQGMFNNVIRKSPYTEILAVPRMHQAFCATWFPAKSNDPKLIPNYGCPVFEKETGRVLAPDTGVPFAIVHQFDRDGEWKAIMENKYQ